PDTQGSGRVTRGRTRRSRTFPACADHGRHPEARVLLHAPRRMYARESGAASFEARLRRGPEGGGLVPAFAAAYAITSLASARIVGGTVRPSACAVLRLSTSSNLVASCTGRLAGFSPLRMRPT